MFAARNSSKLATCTLKLSEGLKNLRVSSESCQGVVTRHLSSLKVDEEGREVVTFLSLNNLSDNPGAVKKVREKIDDASIAALNHLLFDLFIN